MNCKLVKTKSLDLSSEQRMRKGVVLMIFENPQHAIDLVKAYKDLKKRHGTDRVGRA